MRTLTPAIALTLVSVSTAPAAQQLVPGDLLAKAGPSLFEVNKTDGSLTPVTTTEAFLFEGLATLGDEIFATNLGVGEYWTKQVDPGTGLATQYASQGSDSNWHGLAADRVRGVLYSSAFSQGGALVRVEADGSATFIGSGMPHMRGMAYDHNNEVLYGVAGWSDLYTIDTGTGVATWVGPTIDALNIGLAFDDASNTLYAINASGLYTLDVRTGAGTLVGSHGSGPIDGLAVYDTGPICPSLPATEVSRAGTPPNPVALLPGVTTGPVLGSTWDPVIDHSTFLPTAVTDILGVALSPTNIPIPPYGTLLCDVFSFTPYQFTTPAATPFAVPIPLSCGLVGAGLCAQGVSIDALGTIQLTNALDITLGSS